jgi:hypothetical protein
MKQVLQLTKLVFLFISLSLTAIPVSILSPISKFRVNLFKYNVTLICDYEV